MKYLGNMTYIFKWQAFSFVLYLIAELMRDLCYIDLKCGIYQYIKDSKVEICRGGRSTIAVETIAVETIASCADPGGGGQLTIAVEVIAVETIAV